MRGQSRADSLLWVRGDLLTAVAALKGRWRRRIRPSDDGGELADAENLSGGAEQLGRAHAACMLLSCPDGPGIVAAVSGLLFERGANIVASHQYSTHPEHGTLFMRCAFYLPGLAHDRARFEAAFDGLARRFAMRWGISYAQDRRRVAILASRADHCLMDLLWRHTRGELDVDLVCVMSNHEELRGQVEALGIRYVHIPVTPQTKQDAEERMLSELAGAVDLVILARYMQILSSGFLERVAVPLINIHHSFLPAFAGRDPYRQAHERGVKLIGATAHFVTEVLDEGPIIEQDVERVGHDYTLEDLRRVGRDLERVVLARAVRLVLEDRVLVHEGRTIVF